MTEPVALSKTVGPCQRPWRLQNSYAVSEVASGGTLKFKEATEATFGSKFCMITTSPFWSRT